jgi:hypothetical protein
VDALSQDVPTVPSPLRALTPAERLTTTGLALILSAGAFALAFPLFIPLASGFSQPIRWADFTALWHPVVVMALGIVDFLIVLILGLPTLALLHRWMRPRFPVALLASGGLITGLTGLYLGLVPHSTFEGGIFLFWQGTGALSASLFWGLRLALRAWVGRPPGRAEAA